MAKIATTKFRVVSSAYLCSMIRVGIIGGGQLGMMTIEAKYPSLPVEFTVLEQSQDCPAAPIANHFIQGSLQNDTDIRNLANQSDVVTWEIEHINVDTLVQLEKEGKTIIPKPAVLQIIQDKGLQKQDARTADAIMELFRKRESLELFNKKALYIYIREITDTSTPHITRITKKLDTLRTRLFNEYYEHGYIKM